MVFEPVVQVSIAKITLLLIFRNQRVNNLDGSKQKVNSVPLPAVIRAMGLVCVSCGTGMLYAGCAKLLSSLVDRSTHACSWPAVLTVPRRHMNYFWLCKNWLIYRAFQAWRRSLSKLGQKLLIAWFLPYT